MFHITAVTCFQMPTKSQQIPISEIKIGFLAKTSKIVAKKLAKKQAKALAKSQKLQKAI